MKWELIAGLEIHAQLITETKAFCRCPNRYGAAPNTLTCPVCLGTPGALPVLNEEVVRQAAKLALSLEATIHPRSKFDRKNYFYPDLPKGYQISQFDEPFSTGGEVEIAVADEVKRIRITRAHLEEDAGKSMHQDDGSTVVDMNRCGVPLIEIVTEPDFRSAKEAGAFVATVRELLRFIGVCDGNMEEGSLRCDANVSVRLAGETTLRERTEMKNLNSIRNIERAIEAEIKRQIAIYESGGEVHRETLLWDESKTELRAMRRKEGSDDYRYFPEPDLVELEVTPEYIEKIRGALPELPAARRKRYREELQLHPEAVYLLATERGLSDYFEALLKLGVDGKTAGGWMLSDVQRLLNEHSWSIEQFPVPPSALAELIEAVTDSRISRTKSRDVLRAMITDGRPALQIIDEEGHEQIGDEAQLRSIIEPLVARHPDEAERYRSGKKNLLGFFVGLVMKETRGQVDPKSVSRLVEEILNSLSR